MIKKILFIEPKAPNLHIFTAFVSPRLGNILLATIAKNQGYECKIVIESIEKLSLKQIEKYDLIAISTITPTAPRAYAIADYCRQAGKLTIMGGPHVTFCAEEALHHADFVIRGEAEIAFPKFLEVFNKNGPLSEVPNLSYHRKNLIVHNEEIPCTINLDKFPHPDFSLIMRGTKDKYKGHIIPVQTSRGCPYDCIFCSVTTMFGKKYRTFSVDYVIDELLQYNENPNNFIFFYDDHFTANKKRTEELLEKMLTNNFRLRWSAQVRADVAKDEKLVSLMKQAGCFKVFIGFESTNSESLLSMQKKQTQEEMIYAINVLKRNHIGIHGMFVFGFDEDTPASSKRTVQFARKFDLESVQFMILTPFPGTIMYQQLENQKRILFRDWGLYDAHHVVFKPKNFSLFDLQLVQIRGHKKFYSRLRLIKNIFKFKIDNILINMYALRINRLWKKANKPYLKLMNLIKNSKRFDISATISNKIDLMQDGN